MIYISFDKKIVVIATTPNWLSQKYKLFCRVQFSYKNLILIKCIIDSSINIILHVGNTI